MYKKLPLIVMICFTILGCKDKNKLRWTEVNLNISSLTNEEIPESIAFTVSGHKPGYTSITKSDNSIEIKDDILNGKYSGGFIAKSSFRWSYDINIDGEFRDSFYLFSNEVLSHSINKGIENTIHLLKKFKTLDYNKLSESEKKDFCLITN